MESIKQLQLGASQLEILVTGIAGNKMSDKAVFDCLLDIQLRVLTPDQRENDMPFTQFDHIIKTIKDTPKNPRADALVIFKDPASMNLSQVRELAKNLSAKYKPPSPSEELTKVHQELVEASTKAVEKTMLARHAQQEAEEACAHEKRVREKYDKLMTALTDPDSDRKRKRDQA